MLFNLRHMKFLLFSICLTAACLTSCDKHELLPPVKDSQESQRIPLSSGQFIGCWTESMEEFDQNTGRKKMRECNSMTFPMSRYRFWMNLEANGVCQYLELSPNDAHSEALGTWQFDAVANDLIIFNTSGGILRTMHIEAMSPTTYIDFTE